MENQVIAREYINLNRLNALLRTLFGTNFSVDVSICHLIDERFEAELVFVLSGKVRLLSSHRPTEINTGMFMVHPEPYSDSKFEQEQIESITERASS